MTGRFLVLLASAAPIIATQSALAARRKREMAARLSGGGHGEEPRPVCRRLHVRIPRLGQVTLSSANMFRCGHVSGSICGLHEHR